MDNTLTSRDVVKYFKNDPFLNAQRVELTEMNTQFLCQDGSYSTSYSYILNLEHHHLILQKKHEFWQLKAAEMQQYGGQGFFDLRAPPVLEANLIYGLWISPRFRYWDINMVLPPSSRILYISKTLNKLQKKWFNFPKNFLVDLTLHPNREPICVIEFGSRLNQTKTEDLLWVSTPYPFGVTQTYFVFYQISIYPELPKPRQIDESILHLWRLFFFEYSNPDLPLNDLVINLESCNLNDEKTTLTFFGNNSILLISTGVSRIVAFDVLQQMKSSSEISDYVKRVNKLTREEMLSPEISSPFNPSLKISSNLYANDHRFFVLRYDFDVKS